jgi:superoxide dismutase
MHSCIKVRRKHHQVYIDNLNKAIAVTFGSFDEFKTKLSAAGVARFGNGWAWLIVKKAN